MKTSFQILPLGLGLIGYLLWVAPADPDVLFRPVQLLGTLLLTSFFVLSCYGWGQYFWRKLGPRLQSFSSLGSLALGSAGASVTMMLAGHVGMIGHAWDKLWICLLTAGPLMNVKESLSSGPSVPFGFQMKKDGLFKICVAILIAIIASQTAIALLAHGTSDPFLYHLTGPRFWWAMGRVYLPPHLPIIYQGSWWEYLLIWGDILFAEYPGRGLIEAHLFGQLIQVLIGVGGTTLALFVLIEQIIPSFPIAFPVAVLPGISSSSLWNVSCLAKSDLGACFWSLTGLVFLFEENALLAGCFAGFGVAAKWNNGLFIVPTFAAFILIRHFRTRRSLRETLRFTLSLLTGGLVFAAPILVRNGIATGNPVFPLLNEYFITSNLGSSTLAQLPTFGQSYETKSRLSKLVSLLSDSPFDFALLLAPLFLFLRRSTSAVQAVLLGLLVTFGFFTVIGVRDFFPRWLGSAYALAPALGMLIALYTGTDLLALIFKTKSPIFARSFVVLCLSLLILIHRPDWTSLKTVFSFISPSYVIQNEEVHLGGASKAWLRRNAAPSDLIFTTGDNEIYYLSDYNVVPMTEAPAITELIHGLRKPTDLLDALGRAGGRYLLDTQHFESLFWSEQAQILAGLVAENRGAVLFETGKSRVIDIQALREAVSNACILPRAEDGRFAPLLRF